jgi:hypothetical protein
MLLLLRGDGKILDIKMGDESVSLACTSVPLPLNLIVLPRDNA